MELREELSVESRVESTDALHQHRKPTLMKVSCLILSLLLISSSARAADEKTLSSQIEKVTVFLNRAQVFRKAEVRYPSGQIDLIIEDVSPNLDPSSIQVGGKGNFIILDVRHEIDYRAPEAVIEPKEIQLWTRKIALTTDSLRMMSYDVELVTSRRQALQQEKSMLLGNPLITNTKGSDTLPVLRDALIFLRQKLENIHEAMVEAHELEDRLNIEQSEMQQRYNVLVQYRQSLDFQPNQQPEPVQQIRVTVYAKQAGTGSLNVNYTVNGASWSPSYDIRSAGPGKPIKLTYKANLHQSTGEDWMGVPLTLSTHDPSLRQEKPQLPVWYARYFQEVRAVNATKSLSSIQVESLTYGASVDEENESIQYSDAQIAADYTQVVQTFSNVEFTIDLGYEIPSDGIDHLILVQEKELDATYRHYLVPKLERESFIQAQITGWEDLNLLPGLANLFYDGTFVGRANIDPRIFGDTLNLPMGRDRMVYAERKRLDIEEKNKLLNGDRTRMEKWSIEVRNTYATPIHLVVQDQIPVSAEASIKVALKEGDPDRHAEADGMLEWEMDLAGGVRKKWSFAYEVQWDKNRPLILR